MMTVYYSLKEFDFQEQAAKIVLMYVIKNGVELYLLNKEMNSVIKRVEEKENL